MISIATGGKYQLELVDRVLDEGLPFVASYLKRVLNRPIIITDNIGQIHYPDIIPGQIENMFIKIPPGIIEDKFYYQKADMCLYYHIGSNGASAYVIVKNLSTEMVAQTVSVLKEARLAIKCYFSNLNKINKNSERFERELAEYLLLKNNADISDIIKLSEKDLNINTPCFVAIMEADEADCKIDWELIGSYSREYLKKTKLDAIPITLPTCLIFVVPAHFANNAPGTDMDWPRSICGDRYKEFIENKFNMITSIGIGLPYPLSDLHKSYNEARVTLTLLRLMGKKKFMRQFSALGVFSFIFSQDISSIKSYCLKTLGPLIEYDDKTNAELLPTLRSLVDHGFNRTSTANSLYIHINTLHYRINKIEKLINIDLSKTDMRVNLYIAMKVWDTLKIIGFLD